MDDLVAWLRQQLDEDERVALAAAQLAQTRDWWASAEGKVHDANAEGYRNLLGGENAWSLDEIGEHIARWDPARVLAEVEAKRRVLDRYEDALARCDDPDESQLAAGIQVSEYEDWIIPQLAQPYAGQPGWREEWRA